MRSGKLLAEEAPRDLLIKHNRNTLEEVFLKLSRDQTNDNTTAPDTLTAVKTNPNNMPLVSFVVIIILK